MTPIFFDMNPKFVIFNQLEKINSVQRLGDLYWDFELVMTSITIESNR